jgi:hypothetical protein
VCAAKAGDNCASIGSLSAEDGASLCNGPIMGPLSALRGASLLDYGGWCFLFELYRASHCSLDLLLTLRFLACTAADDIGLIIVSCFGQSLNRDRGSRAFVRPFKWCGKVPNAKERIV